MRSGDHNAPLPPAAAPGVVGGYKHHDGYTNKCIVHYSRASRGEALVRPRSQGRLPRQPECHVSLMCHRTRPLYISGALKAGRSTCCGREAELAPPLDAFGRSERGARRMFLGCGPTTRALAVRLASKTLLGRKVSKTGSAGEADQRHGGKMT